MRHYDKGVVVGEMDSPVDFEQWLRGELAQAAEIDVSQPEQRATASANARHHTLKEVQQAYARRSGA